jgi:ribosome-associated translation inhibitor RaiA
MKVNIQHRHNGNKEITERLVKSSLATIGQRRTITEAYVRIEERPELSPPVTVLAHLATPGPDIVVQASDHSLAAAISKVDEKIRGCIAEKERKVARRSQQHAPRSFRGRAATSPATA